MRAASALADAPHARKRVWPFGRPFGHDPISGNARDSRDCATTASIKARFDAGSSDRDASALSILLLEYIFIKIISLASHAHRTHADGRHPFGNGI
jgi:hypothetical protein